jgi:hypothetical protein
MSRNKEKFQTCNSKFQTNIFFQEENKKIADLNNCFRFEIPNYSNKHKFSRCKIIISKLKFQVVVIKMPFRGKIIISELKFQVEVIK